MKARDKQKGNTMLKLAAGLLVLVMLTSHMTADMLARYTTSGTANDEAQTAAFVFSVLEGSGVQYVDISGIEKPGDTVTYQFTVTNYTASQVCEVAQAYEVALQYNGSMPLVCTLNKVGADDSVSLNALAANALPATVKWEDTLPAVERVQHIFTLTVVWPQTENACSYANGSGVSELKLALVSEQIN